VMMIMIHDHVDDRGDVGWGDGNFTGPRQLGTRTRRLNWLTDKGPSGLLAGGATQLLAVVRRSS
jgi:hypothetical protein